MMSVLLIIPINLPLFDSTPG